MDNQQQSQLLKGFGSVTPLHRPEDLETLRVAFEQAVADEVMEEMKAIDTFHKTDTKEQA